MSNQKLQDVIIGKLDSILTRISAIESQLDNMKSDDDFLLEQVNISDNLPEEIPSTYTNIINRSLMPDNGLAPSSKRIYELADQRILQTLPQYRRMINGFNAGYSAFDISSHMVNKPYHTESAVKKMLVVGKRRGYVTVDNGKYICNI
tara:strand:- start:19561 stop:20004 length:444 start_codon:yes stop_codon:yes gene_type:complete